MKWMYCWRCKADMPMLDESEFAVVGELYKQCFGATEEFRQKYGLLPGHGIYERFRPVREAYLHITGYEESNHNAIMHHRISLYGPPCPDCGKPLRTPEAKLCAACSWRVA